MRKGAMFETNASFQKKHRLKNMLQPSRNKQQKIRISDRTKTFKKRSKKIAPGSHCQHTCGPQCCRFGCNGRARPAASQSAPRSCSHTAAHAPSVCDAQVGAKGNVQHKPNARAVATTSARGWHEHYGNQGRNPQRPNSGQVLCQ